MLNFKLLEIISIIGSVLCFILLKKNKKFFYTFNLIDYPNSLKPHKNPTKTGTGIFISLILLILIFLNLNLLDVSNLITEINLDRIYPLFFLALTLYFFSIIDLKKNLNIVLRLFIQFSIIFLSISIVPINLKEVYILFNTVIPVKITTLFLILIWIMIVNIENFIDGVDGSFSIKNLFSTLGFIILNNYSFQSDFLNNILLYILISNFIIYYFNNHIDKIFFSDVGSIVFGYINGWFILLFLSQGFILELIILNSVVYFDIILVWFLKIIKKESIFVRHRDFLFHKLAINNSIKKFQIKYLIFNFMSFVLFLLILINKNLFIDFILLLISSLNLVILYYASKNKF